MTIDVNFRDLGTRDGSFVVSDGKAHFPLQVSEGGVLTSPYKQAADGSFVVEARDRFNIEASRLTAKAKSGELRATVKMSEGKVLPGQPPSVDALWSGTFEDFVVNAVVPETLQRVPGHDDARIFPVRMQARLDTGAGARRSFANQAIAFRSGKFVADVAFPLDIIIEVPQGGGEYKDRDDVSKGTEGGNDEYSHSQEVGRDKALLSTYHFYLMPRTYKFSVKLSIKSDNNSLRLSVSDPHTDDPFSEHQAWCTDGGGLNKVFGALVGSVFGPLGAILGFGVVEKVEDQAKKQVPATIRTTLGQQSFTTIVAQ